MSLPERALSKSQLESWKSCQRKWGWAYLAGLKESNRFASFGTLVHSQLDSWFKDGKLPDDSDAGRVAKSGLHHWPAPNSPGLTVEAHIETQSDVTRLHGYRDLGVEPMLLVGDHKSTVDFKWAETSETLVQDIQFNIYMAASMEEWNVDRATGKWVYYRTRGAKKSLPVVVENYTLQQARDFIGEVIDPMAGPIHQAWKDKPEVKELSFNPRACRDYGGCPYIEHCSLTSSERMVGYMAHSKLADKMKARAAAKAAEGKKEEATKSEAKETPKGSRVTPPNPKGAINPPEGKTKSKPAAEPERDETRISQGKVTSGGYILLENCAPIAGRRGEVTQATELIDRAHEIVRTELELQDYRMAEYGKGPGLLAVALDSILASESFDYIVLDTRTDEARAVTQTFRSRASGIIRGV